MAKLTQVHKELVLKAQVPFVPRLLAAPKSQTAPRFEIDSGE
jgi:hypothetical protein